MVPSMPSKMTAVAVRPLPTVTWGAVGPLPQGLHSGCQVSTNSKGRRQLAALVLALWWAQTPDLASAAGGVSPAQSQRRAGEATKPLPRGALRDTVKKAQARTGKLSVKTDPPGATLVLDGMDVGVTPYGPEAVSPGAHSIVLRLEGYGSVQQDVQVERGEDEAVRIALVPLPPAKETAAEEPAAERAAKGEEADEMDEEAAEARRALKRARGRMPPPEKEAPAPSPTVPLVVAGVAAAGAIGAVVVAQLDVQTADDWYAKYEVEADEGVRAGYLDEARASASRAQLLQIGGAVLGVAAAGAAVWGVLRLLDGGGGAEEEAATITPAWVPGGGAVGVTRRF